MLVAVVKLYHVGAPAIPVGKGVNPKRVVHRVAIYVVALVPSAKAVGRIAKRTVMMVGASMIAI